MAEELMSSGVMTDVQRRQAAAAVAAIEGRVSDAVAGFATVQSLLKQLEQDYLAALWAVDALSLLPDAAPLREAAEAARPLLEELRAENDLAYLDAAVGAAAAPPSAKRGASAIASRSG